MATATAAAAVAAAVAVVVAAAHRAATAAVARKPVMLGRPCCSHFCSHTSSSLSLGLSLSFRTGRQHRALTTSSSKNICLGGGRPVGAAPAVDKLFEELELAEQGGGQLWHPRRRAAVAGLLGGGGGLHPLQLLRLAFSVLPVFGVAGAKERPATAHQQRQCLCSVLWCGAALFSCPPSHACVIGSVELDSSDRLVAVAAG